VPSDKGKAKKTSGKARAATRERIELVRGEPVVQRVLLATLEELARVGYRALRFEDVAARAEVNKTTVYRRWPEKGALVREALGTIAADLIVAPETGALRSDLLALGRRSAELTSSPQGQSIVRMMVAEGSDPEVADLKRALRCKHQAVPMAVMASAEARGELAPGVDHVLLFEAFMGAIHHKIFFMNEEVTDAFLERLVDMLLMGALKREQPAAKSRRRSA
jgi:AcrR family transcriptional regulator